MHLNKVVSCALALAGAALCQVPQVIPYSRTMDQLVVDSTFDGVWRLADLNQDGDCNDAGEVIVFYSDTIGSIVLGNPCCIVCAPDGTTYVGDSTNDIVLALRDQDGDGDCNEPGEHRVFFNSVTNAGGIVMSSVSGITIDAIGRLFLSVANTTTGTDLVIQLFDLDGDGDANDVGEAIDYCTIPGGSGSTGNSIPTRIVAGPGGDLYYADIPSSGALVKGVYRLHDGNFDGDCNDAGEVTLFWAPLAPPFVTSPQYWSLAVDHAGFFYLSDHSANRQIWRGRDADASGSIDPATEQTLFFQASATPPTPIWWDGVLREDGTLLVCDAGGDRVMTLRDTNADGDALDAGESGEAFNAAAAAVAVTARGTALLRAPSLELSPPVVTLGGTTNFVTRAAKPGDLVIPVLSLGLIAPVSLPPWGTLEVDPAQFVVLGFGLADASGGFVQALPIPNVPTALNTYGCQSLAGDLFRLFLSNSALLTVN